MSDFETMPIGTRARLDALESYAREASAALSRMAVDARYATPLRTIGEEQFADPLFVEARVETRIRNAGRRRPTIARG